MAKESCLICTVVYPDPVSETNARILIESLRAFGGSLATIPVLCLVPAMGKDVSPTFRDVRQTNAVRITSFAMPVEAVRFPLAADVAGAAHAENKARDAYDLLVWLGANTIVFQEPRHFLIPDHAILGYCPVHHTNIGSLIDDVLDPFWSLIYQVCKVPEERVFPMKTHVDGKTLRPYFNASSLVSRPDRGLFASWRDLFFNTYQQQNFKKFYEQDERYAIFMHQAILSGIILAMFELNEMAKLPPTYNYPLHLWQDDITVSRPRKLHDLVTARHEVFYRDPNWRNKMPEGDNFKDWLVQRTK